MKYAKMFLLIGVVLQSCVAAPVLPTPTQTFMPELEGAEESDITSTPVLIDSTLGIIEGNISWLDPVKLTKVPVNRVNLEINGHSNNARRYTVKTDLNGGYSFVNIEPGNYGFGVYFSIPVHERLCDIPEFTFDKDFEWLHYATALKGDLWFDIIFSSKDVVVNSGETITMNFVLKCP